MAIIIDSHAHFEPRMLGEDDWLRKLDVAGVDKVALIPSMNDPLPPVPELLLGGVRLLMQSGFTRPIAELLHRATLTDAGNLRLLTGEYKIYAQPDNESAFALVRRLRPWGRSVAFTGLMPLTASRTKGIAMTILPSAAG